MATAAVVAPPQLSLLRLTLFRAACLRKIDNCGFHNDLDNYARLMNRSGRAFLVEHVAGARAPTNRSWCPFNIFRSSNDIRPTWASIHSNLHTTQRFLHVSRPGCWWVAGAPVARGQWPLRLRRVRCRGRPCPLLLADSLPAPAAVSPHPPRPARTPSPCTHTRTRMAHRLPFMPGVACIRRAYPDMLQIGNLRGPLAAAESRTHFGAWCIVSSPLVLGMDLRNETVMGAVWPYVSNGEAIAVNQRWSGDPGRLLNLSVSAGASGAAGSAAAAAAPAPAGGVEVEVWAKLQPSGAVALLAINTDAAASSTHMSVNLSVVWPQGTTPAGWCSSKSRPCNVRDIWKQENGGQTQGGVWHVGALAPHDSAFVLVSPAKTYGPRRKFGNTIL